MHTHVRECESTPERGREYTHEREGEREMIARNSSPFLISNLLKIETTANSFLLNSSFSVGKKMLWPKISTATVNLN